MPHDQVFVGSNPACRMAFSSSILSHCLSSLECPLSGLSRRFIATYVVKDILKMDT